MREGGEQQGSRRLPTRGCALAACAGSWSQAAAARHMFGRPALCRQAHCSWWQAAVHKQLSAGRSLQAAEVQAEQHGEGIGEAASRPRKAIRCDAITHLARASSRRR